MGLRAALPRGHLRGDGLGGRAGLHQHSGAAPRAHQVHGLAELQAVAQVHPVLLDMARPLVAEQELPGAAAAR